MDNEMETRALQVHIREWERICKLLKELRLAPSGKVPFI